MVRHRKYIDIREVEEHITFRNDTGARKELVSPYNFLPFYLPKTYSEIRRIIYLDSDIVVKVFIFESVMLAFLNLDDKYRSGYMVSLTCFFCGF